MNLDYEIIEKEAIQTLHFPENDVLDAKEEMMQRDSDLDRALSLGNLEHSKIRIYFEDDTSKKVVHYHLNFE
jgi:Flp pilus assembly CpaE family ATPase